MMPPVDQTKADPLTQLFDEIELLSAQTRSLELSLKRAHTDAFEQVEKFQQQFRAKVSSLKAEFEDRGSNDPGNAPHDGSLPNLQTQDLLRRLAEQQNLVQRAHEESERCGAPIVALRDQVARLEARNRELEQSAAARVEPSEDQELRHRYRELQGRLAAKESVIESQDYHLRGVQTQLLATRDALVEKERALAEAKARAAEQDQRIHNERNEWQCRLGEAQLWAERRSREIERTKAELAAALERHGYEAQEAQELKDLVDEVARQLNEKQVTLEGQSQELRRSKAREEELSAALAEAQEALARQEIRARDIEQSLTTELAGLRLELERKAEALRERDRLAEMQAAARQPNEITAGGSESDEIRIAALERDLESTKQLLAESQAALERAEKQSRDLPAGFEIAHDQMAAADQSAELRAAQEKIAELLDRLAQLEAARQSLQENAGHELQQLRESFENRIAKLRMELSAKEPAHAPALLDSQAASTALEEGFQKQIQELHRQLAEQRTLLESRNEELIRVKAELDDLHDRFAPVGGNAGQPSAHKLRSVELREEDAVDPPYEFNSSAKPDMSRPHGAGAVRETLESASNRSSEREASVRAWDPGLEKDSAFGSRGRWHMGLFKRRWKAS